jgi:cytochrome c-type biogenesis protein CcmH
MTGTAVLLIALVLLCFWLALRRPDVLQDRYSAEVAHHRAALARIATDTLNPQEAQVLSLDVQRRMLRIRRGAAPSQTHKAQTMVYAFSLAIIAMSVVGYQQFGQRNLQDAPAPAFVSPPAATQNYQNAKAALLKDPSNIPAWIDLSTALQAQGETAHAIEALEVATHAMPTSADLWVARGQALMAHGGGALSPAARYAFDRASVLDPAHPGPRLYLALAWLQAGQPRQALPLLEALAKDSPKDAPWLSRVARMTRGAKAMIAAGVGTELSAR